MDQINLTFADRLRLLRKKKNLEQIEVAKATGINRNQISDYENGRRNPTAKTVQKFADFYNVSIDFLYSGKELKYERPDNQCTELSEKVVPYGNGSKEVDEILKDLSPESRRDVLEIVKIFANNAREKERLAKKKSGTS